MNMSFANAGALYGILQALGFSPVRTVTWAQKPAANQVKVGTVIRVSDFGVNGTHMVSNGTRWRPLGGIATMAHLSAAVTGIGTSEQIPLQTQFPIGGLQAGDGLRIWVAGTKSGTTDTARINVRVGTAGTTGDTALTGLSNLTLMTTTNIAFLMYFEVRLASVTSMQKLGLNAAQNGSGFNATSAAIAAATTITDASANALYVSLGFSMNASSDTMSLLGARIELLTP